MTRCGSQHAAQRRCEGGSWVDGTTAHNIHFALSIVLSIPSHTIVCIAQIVQLTHTTPRDSRADLLLVPLTGCSWCRSVPRSVSCSRSDPIAHHLPLPARARSQPPHAIRQSRQFRSPHVDRIRAYTITRVRYKSSLMAPYWIHGHSFVECSLDLRRAATADDARKEQLDVFTSYLQCAHVRLCAYVCMCAHLCIRRRGGWEVEMEWGGARGSGTRVEFNRVFIT